MNQHPALTLDQLSTDWLPRRMTGLAAMPGLNNNIGSVQMEADPAAIKHMIFPPYSAGNETTWATVVNGKLLAMQVPAVEIRWRAYQVERRCTCGGFSMESVTSLLPAEAGAVVRLSVTNTAAESQDLQIGFLCSGRAANEGGEGYAWAVPSVPTDVFSFVKEAGLRQYVSPASIGGEGAAICIANEKGNAHAVQTFDPTPDSWEEERKPAWRRALAPGETFTITLLATFHADKQAALEIARRWHGRGEAALAEGKARWENLWMSAFTPDNEIFSGHLPVLHCESDALLKLYYNGVLTLLTCRRDYPNAVTHPVYLTLWPRRGEGSNYLAWEINCTSGILARLDPAALRSHWLLLASAPWLDYQVTNFFNGEHGGWTCCAQPQSVITGALNLRRWHGDTSWQTETITRKPRRTAGFEGASQGLVVDDDASQAPVSLTGRDVLSQAVFAHRAHHLSGKALVDFGGRAAYLECISTYAHGTAGHTAIQRWAADEAAGILGAPPVEEQLALLEGILGLKHEKHGFFYCEYPDGTRHPAPNLYDLALVLRYVGKELPEPVREAIVKFVRSELLTPTWSHCLWPSDADSLSTTRADHQWSGCFSGWIPLFVLGVMKAGLDADWVGEWLEGVAKVTRQGPFSQAYWAEDVYPPEAGAAAKCFDELTQGNHWVIGSGVLFAEMVLDGICGLDAALDGSLTATPSRLAEQARTVLTGIRCQGKDYELRGGRLQAL